MSPPTLLRTPIATSSAWPLPLGSKLSDAAIKEVEAVLKKHGANVLKVDHPTANLEDLFLKTVQESRDRPGHRLVQDGKSAS